MAIINITLIHNASSVVATVINHDHTADTDGLKGVIAPGETRSLQMWVPWCSGGGDFDTKHIDVTLTGKRTFKIWQADQSDGDRVRVSSSGWINPGEPIGGFAAVGPLEATIPFLGNDRELIINDRGVWLMPIPLIGLLQELGKAVSLDGYHICGDAGTRPVPSVPKSSAVAFSMAGIPSDEFDYHHPDARFLYRDSGKRYEFTIKSDGSVGVHPVPPSSDPVLQTAMTFDRVRDGDVIAPHPQFDLIAANGGRVFVKEKDVDRFYFAVIDNSFIHLDPLDPKRGEFAIPDTYFKLDPEFNQPGARIEDVMAPLTGDFGGHPTAARFPLYKFALAFGIAPTFVVRVKRGVWHLIDSRPPLMDLQVLANQAATGAAIDAEEFATALRAFGDLFKPLADMLQGFVNSKLDNLPSCPSPSYSHVQYCAKPPSVAGPQPSIDFQRVLDIGVGHVHLHQQFEGITGGEIAGLLGRPTGSDLLSNPVQLYQFLNGPINDADGYNDGTCNYYVLAQLRDGTFALLFMDEQSFFSQRWRLADPSDRHGVMVTLIRDVADHPEKYPLWNEAMFWSPFRAGRIGLRSRLAVSAQVVLVTGDLPGDGAPLIYSTNFSWGTMDRTWRWRPLPPGTTSQYFDALPDETVGSVDNTVYPQSIRLRDDMTLHLKGRHNGEAGRWCQRYLPANNALVPGELVAGAMPATGYSHPWRFVPEPIFALADAFSHFFVYDVVDSRTKYYPIDITSPTYEKILQAADPNEMWSDGNSGQLFIDSYAFRIEELNIPWPPAQPPPQKHWAPPSFYNDKTLLRIVKRGSKWIAMHWDKRDDDMEPLSELPRSVTLLPRAGGHAISVTVNPAIQIASPPAVQRAFFWWVDAATAAIAFSGDNVWRIRMAAFNLNGAVVKLLDLTLDVGFKYNAAAGVYQHQWVPSAATAVQLRAYATDDGARQSGTSIWFEDMTGHVAPPEQAKWTRPPEMRVTVDPAKIPLGLLVPVTVHAQDAFTSATLKGIVSIGGVTSGRTTDNQFSYTFFRIEEDPPSGGLHPPRPKPKGHALKGMVTVDQYPDTPIPFVFYDPSLSIHVDSATVPAGQPVQISVEVRDAETNTPVAARLAIAGQNVGTTNSPAVSPRLNHTFAPGVVTITVSADGYPDASFTVSALAPAPPPPPPPRKKMHVAVQPARIPLGLPVSVMVHAQDESTSATLPGRISIEDATDGRMTDQRFTLTFSHIQVDPIVQEDPIDGGPHSHPQPHIPRTRFPAGIVSVDQYEDAAIPFVFYSPRLSIQANSAPVPAGKPIQFSVDVRDMETNTPVAANLTIAGQNVGAANSPVVSPLLNHTFATGVATVTVSAAGYPAASFTVTAYTPSLKITVDPSSPEVGVATKITVHAGDSTTGAVPAGGCRVWIDGKDIESTDKQFSYTFRPRRVGPPRNPTLVFPKGLVRAAGYPDAAIDFGFDPGT